MQSSSARQSLSTRLGQQPPTRHLDLARIRQPDHRQDRTVTLTPTLPGDSSLTRSVIASWPWQHRVEGEEATADAAGTAPTRPMQIADAEGTTRKTTNALPKLSTHHAARDGKTAAARMRGTAPAIRKSPSCTFALDSSPGRARSKEALTGGCTPDEEDEDNDDDYGCDTCQTTAFHGRSRPILTIYL